MKNPFITNSALKDLIQKIRISDSSKKTLIDGLPKLGQERREKLLRSLKDLYLLDKEETAAIERIEKSWIKS